MSGEEQKSFPVACLGGSAGSLRPCIEVIQEIPADTPIALVIVNHIRRADTRLPHILKSKAALPVKVIESGMKLEPRTIYVNPPNKDLTLSDGEFLLKPLSKAGGWPKVVTVFLESLAKTWKGKAIATILSGLDADGSDALRDIKACGGITIAQKPETAEQSEMPQRALETGFVDMELTPVEIGRKLTEMAQETKLPTRPTFPIVGIGASAGGLDAFTQLLEHLPRKTGLGYVLVQHLDPSHESLLVPLLQNRSAMPVREVRGAMPVEPDAVYVIPPDANLTIADGILQTVPRSKTSGRNMPIDDFLVSLAKDRQNTAFAVILSGTASDGTFGAKSVKDEGGITFAQEPATAKFDSMPRNAIASGAIDFILAPEEIAKQLINLASHPYLIKPVPQLEEVGRAESTDLDRIFLRLRNVTGIDFTYYKHNTILRRIKRRMALRGIESMSEYARLVQESSTEAHVVAQDFLVHVTSFFREPEVHKVLEEVVFPTLLENRHPDDPIRIWVPGCSTGEEAYSLAIILTEYLDKQRVRPRIQIFATDVNDAVLEKARAGVYLDAALAGVSPERLERFFVPRDRAHQVVQSIREICVFARQDLTKDPPFSKMDLISCCNLLIYLGTVLQRRALIHLDYAIKPGGFLVLGKSESLGHSADFFDTIDHKCKVFQRKRGVARSNYDIPLGQRTEGASNNPRPPADFLSPSTSIQREAERMLLAEYAPTSIIINEAMHVLQVRGQVDAYLQVPQGPPTTLLPSMARPGLLTAIRSAVEEAKARNSTAVEKGLRIKLNDELRLVNLKVSPIRGSHSQDRCFLVLFEESAENELSEGQSKQTTWTVEKAGHGGEPDFEADRLRKEIARLEQELTGTREYLQSIIEAQETATEELRSANEEAQANNEELDTAKEELQASNEELNTVNEELRIRNAEQNNLNSDLRRLLESINVPLVMVGSDLRIRWFTAAMEPVLNLLPNDQGRPITDLRATLIPDFVPRLVRILSGEEVSNYEFQHPNGKWLSLRILPFRGPENRIEGAIATLVDIDDLKRARDFAEAVVETVREPLIVLDADLRVRTANAAFYHIFQLEREQVEGQPFYDIGKGQWNSPRLIQLLEEILPRESSLKNYRVEHVDQSVSGTKTNLLNAREIHQRDGDRLILLAIDDITELRRSTEELERANQDLKQFIFAASHDLKEPVRMIVAHTQLIRKRLDARLDKELETSINFAVEGALRLEALILGLSEFWQLSERVGDGRIYVNCNDALQKAISNLEHSIRENQAIVTSDPLPTLLVSETALIQLFQNLLENGLKYRGSDKPEIHISAGRSGSGWVFCFRDNGIGIDPKYHEQIFKVFKRLHPPNKYSGTGMGLAICQKIVERWGGRIWVESESGHGAEFKFTIPG